MLFADGGNSKVGIQESSFSYTDYAIFHIKGRGADDSNVTGMTFHASSSNANSRNFSITTNVKDEIILFGHGRFSLLADY